MKCNICMSLHMRRFVDRFTICWKLWKLIKMQLSIGFDPLILLSCLFSENWWSSMWHQYGAAMGCFIRHITINNSKKTPCKTNERIQRAKKQRVRIKAALAVEHIHTDKKCTYQKQASFKLPLSIAYTITIHTSSDGMRNCWYYFKQNSIDNKHLSFTAQSKYV